MKYFERIFKRPLFRLLNWKVIERAFSTKRGSLLSTVKGLSNGVSFGDPYDFSFGKSYAYSIGALPRLCLRGPSSYLIPHEILLHYELIQI